MVHDLEHAPFLRELDLGLCRVDIHIDPGAAELKVHDAGGIAPGQKAVFYTPARPRPEEAKSGYTGRCSKNTARCGCRGRRRETMKPWTRSSPSSQEQGSMSFAISRPSRGVHRGLGAPVAGGEELLLPVADETDGYLGSPEGAAQRHLHAGGGLAAVGFQKLEPRGVL